MPFDKPRIFSGDGSEKTDEVTAKTRSTQRSENSLLRELLPDEELGLSAELQVLAAHLRGEADALNERYAAATRSTSPSLNDRRFGRRWVWQCVAVGLAGLALLAWRIDRWQAAPPAAHVENIGTAESAGNVAVAVPQQADHVAVTAPASSVPLVPRALKTTSPGKIANADPAAIRRTQGIAEVGIDEPAVERHPPVDQVEMLRIQALGFEKVIRKLQAELVARDTAQIESQHQIQSLQAEVQELHKQLDDMRR